MLTFSKKRVLVVLCLLGFVICILTNYVSVLICASEAQFHGRNSKSDAVIRPMTPQQLLQIQHGQLAQDSPVLVQYLRKWLVAPSDVPFTVKDPEKVDYSEYGQTSLVSSLLNGRTKGFFVEAGAADGITNSNTLALELFKNWTGILIEPNTYFYRHLLKSNRRAYSLNGCLSPKNSSMIATFRPVGLNGGIDNEMEKIHVDHIKKDFHYKHPEIVQCYPLYSIMLALGGTNHIDYLSLDLEGAELQVLQNIPFEKLTIDIISVEYRVWGGSIDKDGTKQRLQKLRSFFRKKKYYQEVGIVPPADDQSKESKGVDVFFQRITKNTPPPPE